MNTFKKLLLLAGAVSLLCLGACKSHKGLAESGAAGYESQQQAAQQPATAPVATAPSAATGQALKSDFERMAGAYQSWADLTVPIKVNVAAPRSASLSGTLTMAYGKSLSLSLKMLFVEAASVYIDTDSVFVVSKIAGAYYAESLQKFTASTGFGICDIQSLLLGQAFVPGKGAATAADASAFSFAKAPEIDADGIYGITLTPAKMPKGVDWSFTAIAPDDASLGAVPQLFAVSVEAGRNVVQCTFAQSELSQAGVIAAKMQFEGLMKDKRLDFTIAANTSKAVWNSGARPVKMTIPKSLTRMTTEQLLKKLGNK